MKKVKGSEKVTNEVLEGIQEKKMLLNNIRRGKAKRTGHIQHTKREYFTSKEYQI